MIQTMGEDYFKVDKIILPLNCPQIIFAVFFYFSIVIISTRDFSLVITMSPVLCLQLLFVSVTFGLIFNFDIFGQRRILVQL